MNKSRFLMIILTLFIFIILFVIFISKLIVTDENSLKQYTSEKILNNVKIYENNFGIGHIIAVDDYDLFFGIGYYQASKRLWQIDFLRRAALGNLSEILGEDALNYDKFLRSFDIKTISLNNYNKLSGKSQSILKAFSDGINFYIEKNKNSLSVEFGLLNYNPEKWQEWHSLAIGRLLSLEFSFGIWFDIVNAQIVDKLGINYLESFVPNYNNFSFSKIDTNSFISRFSNNNYSEFLKDIVNNFGLFSGGIGSNSWITISGDNQKQLILANDPHTAISSPARWMQVHITNSELNVVGLVIPGIPLPIIGRNDNIAFGITSILIDDFDYFSEKLTKDGKSYYINDSNTKKIEYKIDSIKIKNKETYKYYQRRTNRSIIISDNHLSKYDSKNLNQEINKNYFNKNILTYQWIGSEISDEILALYKINKSQNFNEFYSGLQTWATPSLYISFIDKNQDIKIVPVGKYPIRHKDHNPLLPYYKDKTNHSWLGTEFIQKKKIINDSLKKGFLVSANTDIIKIQDYLTNYWEPDSRFLRINEVLDIEKNNNIERTKYLQLDLKSKYAEKFCQFTLPIINEKNNLLNDLELKALEKLKNWDFIISTNSVAASIYIIFYKNLIKNTFADELGENLMSQYTFNSSYSTRKILELLSYNNHKIFDNLKTKEIENKNYIIFISFKETIQEIINIFKTSTIAQWKYGTIHTIQPEHILERIPLLKPLFEYSSEPIGGNNTTILNTDWNYNEPFKARVYPSVRFITDLNDSLVYVSLPGGISGNPTSNNYKDQYQLWLNGGYINLNINKNPGKNFKLKTYIINK